MAHNIFFNVSADYLMGDSLEEVAFNALCPGDRPPFYKIFMAVTEEMGLDIAENDLFIHDCPVPFPC